MRINEQRGLILWAAFCALRVLPRFMNRYPADRRPLQAIQAASAWLDGTISVREARRATFAAHAAAWDVESENPAACAAARSAGHVAATAHVPRHARHAAEYAIKAVALAWDSYALLRFADTTPLVEAERRWQREHPFGYLRVLVFPDEEANQRSGGSSALGSSLYS